MSGPVDINAVDGAEVEVEVEDLSEAPGAATMACIGTRYCFES
ncbi:hypothetical protein ACFXDJ_10250 [Streptomyces sp. NPDC059443]